MILLKIISPEKELLSKEVESVELPGAAGRFVVLSDHAPIISSLVNGVVTYSENGVKSSIGIGGGFAEVRKNRVTVCVG